MKNAIEELIFQNSLFMESIQYNEKYDSIIDETTKLYNKLKGTLNEDQIKMLDELIDKRIELESEGNDCNLAHGFKTALKLVIECL